MPHITDVRDVAAWIREHVKLSRNASRVASKHGIRPYMAERYYRMLGSWEEVASMLEAFDARLNPVVRCNTLKVRGCGEVEFRLTKLGYSLKRVEWCPYCFEVTSPSSTSSLGATHEFLAGMYYLHRGPASLIPPQLLSPSPGEFVADLAAAPGGKLTHLAQLMGNSGAILGVDISRARMRALRSNVERLGVRNAVLLRSDGRYVPHIYPSFFTKVLLDAPCTGEGLMMIDRSRKTKTSLEDILRSMELQVQLLDAALNSVMKGGLVLYITCSIAPEEDEVVVAELLSRREDVEAIPLNPPVKARRGLTEYLGLTFPQDLRKCVRLYPHVSGTEGFFMCLLKRVS
ncbi:MAG: RsmB/NOP family class I SAM-dependent RNA methyltransferase [Desulfurococcales archaeon]|nr:RsmB/NOP family class I SAM-dependent RNA methyltransferase [Desulfurococcales archaeon]